MAECCLMGQPLQDLASSATKWGGVFISQCMQGEPGSHREYIHNTVSSLIKCLSEVSPTGKSNNYFSQFFFQEEYLDQNKRLSPCRKHAECGKTLGSVTQKSRLVTWIRNALLNLESQVLHPSISHSHT